MDANPHLVLCKSATTMWTTPRHRRGVKIGDHLNKSGRADSCIYVKEELVSSVGSLMYRIYLQ